MDLGIRDHVIVVTGGGSGIGKAITLACLAEGATVVIVSRSSKSTTRFCADLRDSIGHCDYFAAELAEAENCRTAVEYVKEHYGRIDGLVNNAGTNDRVGLESGSPEMFTESLRQSLLHYYSMTHYALPILKESKGSILNVSSKVALRGQGGTSGYAAAKGAQLALTREWAAELLPFGIRVNSIVPAEVMTPLYRHWIGAQSDPEIALKRIENQIPLERRMTKASEIASMAVFLLSPIQSGHTTAQHLVVDGGYTHLNRKLP